MPVLSFSDYIRMPKRCARCANTGDPLCEAQIAANEESSCKMFELFAPCGVPAGMKCEETSQRPIYKAYPGFDQIQRIGQGISKI